MKSIVTGGKGFIGSVLAKKLIDQGDEVIVIDKAQTYNKIQNVKYFDIDLNNFEEILPIFDSVDRVFHLAADVSIEYCKNNPRLSGINNSNTTLNVLECCRIKNIKRLVFSSTSAVYKEKNSDEKYKETDETNPLNLYSASKLFGEYLCKIYWELYKIETVVLRYFNVYGSTMSNSPYAAVMVKFLNNYKQNIPIKIYGDGLQTRDFVYVEDVADINILASLKELPSYGNIYNVGTSKSISINYLASLISNKIEYSSLKIGELKYSCCDNIKTLNTFDWSPKEKVENWLKTIIKTND